MYIDLKNKRIVIAGVTPSKANETEMQILQLENKIKSYGGEVVGTLFQKRGVSRSGSPGGSQKGDTALDPSTYIGKGKTEELKQLCVKTKSDLVIFINELSKSQQERLSGLIDCEINWMSNL